LGTLRSELALEDEDKAGLGKVLYLYVKKLLKKTDMK
jgi:hypothetical protein